MANISKRTPKRESLILEELRTWPTYNHACASAGIAFPTLLRWMRDDPAFAEKVEAARAEGGRVLEDELVKRATEGKDTTALIFALKSWYRSRYGERQAIEHSGADGSPLVITITGDDA